MIEATLEGPSGLLRVMTTHLEFHSHRQRLAQLKRIMDIEFEVYNLNQIPPLSLNLDHMHNLKGHREPCYAVILIFFQHQMNTTWL